MDISLYIARRLRLQKPNASNNSPGVKVATIGVAISLAIMMLSISIVIGFQNGIREKIEGFDSQIIITPDSDTSILLDSAASNTMFSPDIMKQIKNHLGSNASCHATSSTPIILKGEENFAGVILKELPKDQGKQLFLNDNIIKRDSLFNTEEKSVVDGIIISSLTANALKADIGDKIYLNLFSSERIKTRRLPIVAIYDTHFADYDSKIAFTTSESLINNIGDISPIIEIDFPQDDPDHERINEITDQLNYFLTGLSAKNPDIPLLRASSIHQRGAMYYGWLDLLNTNVIVILILMALVSGFTLVSSTFIIILERVRTIGILKTIGMTDSAIRRIFIYVGQRLVLRGLLIGNAIGLGVILLQWKFRLIPLDPDAYYLNYVPVELSAWWVILLNAIVVAISALMLLLPTRVICKMTVSSTIKFE